IQQRGEVLNNLLNVSSYLTSVLDPDELLASLARRVVEVVPAGQAGGLWLYDRQQSALRIVSIHRNEPGARRELPPRLRVGPGVGLAGVVLQRGEPMLIEGRGRYREMTARTSPSPNNDLRQFLELLPRELTAVLLPLRTGNQIIGVLELLNMGQPPAL